MLLSKVKNEKLIDKTFPANTRSSKFLPNLNPVISSQKIDLAKLTKEGVLKKAKK